MKIRIIGYGKLAQLMVKIWQKHHHLSISSPSLENSKTEHYITSNNNTLFLEHQDMIVLAVKPKMISIVLNQIEPFLSKDTLLVSLAAGITLDKLKQLVPKEISFIRAMPNIASELGQSATLLLGKTQLKSQKISAIEHCFSQLGSIDWVEDDNQLDIGTVIAGSGPAYVFYIMESIQNSAIELGLPKPLAQKLVKQTFLGASMMAIHQNQSLKQLQEQVTSPQGTTAAALAVMEHQQLNLTLDQAIQAAWQKVLDIRT
jgi:pyrroline-5-carboxylate reductase